MQYKHQYVDGTDANLPVGKVVCVGRNYADHAAELNNPVPITPMLFIKPSTAIVPLSRPFEVPVDFGSVHFETEMAVLIGQPLKNATHAEVDEAIVGVGIALDLTLRDLQSKLKQQGHPWEKAKGFDGSCPLSAFLEPVAVGDLQDQQIRLTVNGQVRQNGNSSHMLNKVHPLIAYMSHYFTLLPGDVVLTGTPAGVGAVNPGDKLLLELGSQLRVETQAI
ncbi:fumarylacetoacetate hydrolase family protein [Amphritea pacifica]|uniref:Fumarylacetoacetate hydrolase family protein n=1 Tax=Amphritea pacifica TaxID=2811233 RepID=A0ABS2W416_9GAMM|nr:fumarylacetoacetate hydrolase family protein [Amphritea pacifica]MBN0986247.1 fumarylacetoacetate hydrolase family protein [Amphritea pacifica]